MTTCAIKFTIYINKIQILIGMVSLFLGGALYVIRSSGDSYFVPQYLVSLRLPDAIVDIIRIVGGNLPDFIHPFAFILITAGLLSSANRKTLFFICLGWFFIESLFELGQLFKEAYVRFIPSWFDQVPVLNHTKSFFLNGTFDILDMIAIGAGTFAAFFTLLITTKRRIE